MKKVIYETYGNPAEVLKAIECDPVDLASGQARVSVLRAPINPSDLIQVSGNYGVRPDLPAVAGNEGIGRITQVSGEGLSVGQLVLLPVGTGTWMSEMVCDMARLVALPDGDLDQLSMLAVNPATAQILLSDFIDLRPGDWVIQSAANSAVGGYVVQLARALGVHVVNVVRREDAIEDVKRLGGEIVLVDGPDLVERVAEATSAEMKLALDAVAGETAGRLAETLENGGLLVSYGGMSNQPSTLSASALIFKGIRVQGFWLAQWFQEADSAARQAVYGKLIQAIADGSLYAPIDRHFTLDEVADAAAYSWAGGRKGKVILAPNGI